MHLFAFCLFISSQLRVCPRPIVSCLFIRSWKGLTVPGQTLTRVGASMTQAKGANSAERYSQSMSRMILQRPLDHGNRLPDSLDACRSQDLCGEGSCSRDRGVPGGSSDDCGVSNKSFTGKYKICLIHTQLQCTATLGLH